MLEAFNVVPMVPTHQSLRPSLASWLIPEELIAVIMRCYTGHDVYVPFDTGSHGTYRVETGVLQGDTLAPFLFVLLLDSILHESITPQLGIPLTASAANYQPRREGGAGMTLRHRQIDPSDFITELAYADDMAILSPSPAGAETQLRNVQAWSERCGLFLNCKKGKTEVFHVTPGQQRDIHDMHGELVSLTTTYKYLGGRPMHPAEAFQERKQLTWGAIHKFDALWRAPGIAQATKVRLFETLITPIFTYASAVWPATAVWTAKIDGVYSTMLRYATNYRSDSKLRNYRFGNIPLASSNALLRW